LSYLKSVSISPPHHKAPRTYQHTSNLVQSPIQDLLANGIMSSSIVVCSILLSADQQLGVEQLSVVASADFIDGGRV